MDSWTADDSCGECCTQLYDFHWMIQADDRVGGLPVPELREALPDIEYDVYDVIPAAFPVRMETMAVKSLCSPVVVQTIPHGGCDPVLPPCRCRGRDFLTEDSLEVVDSGRESIIPDSDVCGGICVMPDRITVVLPKSAVVPLAASVVAQTRPRGGCCSNLLLPVDRSIEPLDGYGPDVLISGRESAVMISDVDCDICVEPGQLPVVVSEEVVGPLAFTAVDLTRSQGTCCCTAC